MSNHAMCNSAIIVRLVTTLALLKARHPARMSVADLRDAMAAAGHPYCRRSVERYLNSFAASGLVLGDGEMPQGWALTEAGKEFLGVRS